MNFAMFLKTIVILAVLFVMLYVGMNNTHEINFFFPIAGTTAKKPIHESAALIFFGIFAIGVLAGTMMNSGGGGKSGGSKKSGSDRKEK
jgi:fucose permease